MKKPLDIKKLLILNLPYILLGLFATNFGEGWRMAQGADVSARLLSFFSTLPAALGSWWPSLHPVGPAGRYLLRGCPAAGGLCEREKRQEISQKCGIWLCPLGNS